LTQGSTKKGDTPNLEEYLRIDDEVRSAIEDEVMLKTPD
jgi:hypothetical protein